MRGRDHADVRETTITPNFGRADAPMDCDIVGLRPGSEEFRIPQPPSPPGLQGPGQSFQVRFNPPNFSGPASAGPFLFARSGTSFSATRSPAKWKLVWFWFRRSFSDSLQKGLLNHHTRFAARLRANEVRQKRRRASGRACRNFRSAGWRPRHRPRLRGFDPRGSSSLPPCRSSRRLSPADARRCNR